VYLESPLPSETETELEFIEIQHREIKSLRLKLFYIDLEEVHFLRTFLFIQKLIFVLSNLYTANLRFRAGIFFKAL
jgi:hypothetical protein